MHQPRPFLHKDVGGSEVHTNCIRVLEFHDGLAAKQHKRLAALRASRFASILKGLSELVVSVQPVAHMKQR